MSEAKEKGHTPLPWWVSDSHGLCVRSESGVVADCDYRLVSEPGSARANADLIVAAVNAHEAMTDLAKTVELVCNVRGPITQDARRMLLDKAALALAKAKEPNL